MTHIYFLATIESLVNKLYLVVDELAKFETKGSGEERRILLLKPFILYLEEQVLFENFNITIEALRKHAGKLSRQSKPYGTEPEGIRIYCWSLIQMCSCLFKEDKLEEAVKIGHQAEKVYNDYKAMHPASEPWIAAQILECVNVQPVYELTVWDRSFELMDMLLSCTLFYALGRLGRFEEQLPYAMKTIKQSGMRVLGANLQLERLDSIVQALYSIHRAHRFKQLDHLLAIGMHTAVKLRTNHRGDEKLDVLQGKLCLNYFMWGYTIANESMKKLTNKPDVAVIDNETFESIEEYFGDGYGVYEHLFPIELVNSAEEAKKLFKKAKVWLKRAVSMHKDNCRCTDNAYGLVCKFEEEYLDA